MRRRRRLADVAATSPLDGRQEAASALEEAALLDGADITGRPELQRFGDLDAALAYLHGRWVTYLGVAVDAEIEDDGCDPLSAVVRSWDRLRARHPGLAAILAHYGTAPAVVRADERHRRLIASTVGCQPEELPCFAGPCHPRPHTGRLRHRLATASR